MMGKSSDAGVCILSLLAISPWHSLNFSESSFPLVRSWNNDITTFIEPSGRINKIIVVKSIAHTLTQSMGAVFAILILSPLSAGGKSRL